jgi:hypothetical protein
VATSRDGQDLSNLTSIIVDHKLPDGLVKIKAIYHGSNNDSSQISTLVINVSNSDKVSFVDQGIIMDENYNIQVNMAYDNGVDSIKVKHYVNDELLYDTTFDTFSFTLGHDDNTIVGRHILELKTETIDNETSEPRFISFEVQQLDDGEYVIIIPNIYGDKNKTTVNLEKYAGGNNGFDYTFPVIF